LTRHAQLLWFDGCPSHEAVRSLLLDAVARLAPDTTVEDVDASDAAVAVRLRFPGSPTIRIDGVDIEPGFQDPGDYTPRCRLYRTDAGLRGVPDPRWIEEALLR
jgi:hypothetical protein